MLRTNIREEEIAVKEGDEHDEYEIVLTALDFNCAYAKWLKR